MAKACIAWYVGVVTLICSTILPARPRANDARTFPSRMLNAHNAVRARAGSAPLQWDDQLGREAAQYAMQLAISRTFAHSAARGRNGAGENLWMGTRGAFSAEAMVASWESEKRQFAGGVFPNVSRNGNWHEIGHYTQMIWPSTRRVGCAVATSAWADYLVCRYSPAGNVSGTAIYRGTVALSSTRLRALR